jgi:hypothetical protein
MGAKGQVTFRFARHTTRIGSPADVLLLIYRGLPQNRQRYDPEAAHVHVIL